MTCEIYQASKVRLYCSYYIAGKNQKMSRRGRQNSTVEGIEGQPEVVTTHRRQTYITALKQIAETATGDAFQQLSLAQVQDLLVTLGNHFSRFEIEHLALISAAGQEQNSVAHMQVFADTNREYMLTRSVMAQRIADLLPPPMQHEPMAQQAVPEVRVNVQAPDALSNITNTWGTFSGDYSQWHSFRDRFRAAVHVNDAIPVTFKFQYLQASVTGAAAKAMGKWRNTDTNYNRAWDRLCEVFEDDYLAVQTLVRRLLAIPRMQAPTHIGLRLIIDTIHECVNQLSNFVDIENWDPILVFMTIDLLDPVTYEAWESFRDSSSLEQAADGTEMEVEQEGQNAQAPLQAGAVQQPNDNGNRKIAVHIPSWQQMVCFLEKRARILVHAERRDKSMTGASVQPAENKQGNRSRDSSTNRKPRPPSITQSQPSASTGRPGNRTTGYPPCVLCGLDHALYRCS